MKLKLGFAAIAACTLITGTALADVQTSSAGSVAGGAAAADRQGAVAGGVAASKAQQNQRKARKHNRQNRNGGNREMSMARCVPGTASTSTTGAVHTTRNSGSAAINTNGTASGSGTVRSSSTGDVYSSTTKEGSTADAFGESNAVAREPTRRC